MCETIVVIVDGHVRGVQTWTEGFKSLKCRRKPVTQDTVLEFAVRLERRGFHDEAEILLDRFCACLRVELAG